MILQENDLEFNFQGCINCFKFDESSPQDPHFHGLSHCMKAVDFIVETTDKYFFIEIKDYTKRQTPPDTNYTKKLLRSLVGKFRDSFIYRWSEKKADKPIIYLCLLELDNALISYLTKQLRNQLPEHGPKNNRWKRDPALKCIVVNINLWNENFPEWQVKKI